MGLIEAHHRGILISRCVIRDWDRWIIGMSLHGDYLIHIKYLDNNNGKWPPSTE
jgi:hypothetical protein